MNKNLGVVNIMSVLFFAALIYGYINYIHKENDEIERLKLSYAIDYATDAGAMAMLQSQDLGYDYTQPKASFTVNPQLALDAFLDVFCYNYDLQPTYENRSMIKEFIPVATVATNDGFYLASQQQVSNETDNYPGAGVPAGDVDWDLVFGMKMPYTHTIGATSYALTMSMEYTWALTGSIPTKQSGLPPGMSKADAREKINNIISQDMAYTINKTNSNNPYWKNSFYIPSQLTTFSGVNPIEGPSFLVLVQNLNITTSKPISGFSVAGSKIDAARMIVGYTRDGVKYYAYADRINDTPPLPPLPTVEAVFTTVKEAALAGYYYDAMYMK